MVFGRGSLNFPLWVEFFGAESEGPIVLVEEVAFVVFSDCKFVFFFLSGGGSSGEEGFCFVGWLSEVLVGSIRVELK